MSIFCAPNSICLLNYDFPLVNQTATGCTRCVDKKYWKIYLHVHLNRQPLIFGVERGNRYTFTARLLKTELVYLCVFRFYGILFSLVGINTKLFQNEYYTKSIPIYYSILHDISKKHYFWASSIRRELFHQAARRTPS